MNQKVTKIGKFSTKIYRIFKIQWLVSSFTLFSKVIQVQKTSHVPYIASKKTLGLVAAATFKIRRKWIVIVGEYFKQKTFLL